jgi:hypothetical protein
VVSYGFDLTVADAMLAFDEAFDELDSERLTASEQANLDRYYSDVFVPRLAENVGSEPTDESYLPDSPAQSYLQYHDPSQSDDFDTPIEIDHAGDGSEWTRAHSRFHPYFRDTTLRFGFEDMIFIDTRGTVVFDYLEHSGVMPLGSR